MKQENFINANIIGKTILGKVTKVGKKYFEIVTPNKIKGIIFIKEISDFFVKEVEDLIQINKIIYVKVKGIYEDKLICSFKENRADFLRSPFDFEIKNTQKDFENLYNFTNEEVRKWKK